MQDYKDDKKVAAFLKLLRWTEHYPHEPSEINYKTIYGGGTMSSFDDHPRKVVHKWGRSSTAAGAYQIKKDVFDVYKKRLGLKDFSPESQDRISIRMIEEAGALTLIKDGSIEKAIQKLNGLWVSLPGGSQSIVKMPDALQKYDEYLNAKPVGQAATAK